MACGIAIIEMVGIGSIKIHGTFYESQAQDVGIKIIIGLGAAGDCGDVMNPRGIEWSIISVAPTAYKATGF